VLKQQRKPVAQLEKCWHLIFSDCLMSFQNSTCFFKGNILSKHSSPLPLLAEILNPIFKIQNYFSYLNFEF